MTFKRQDYYFIVFKGEINDECVNVYIFNVLFHTLRIHFMWIDTCFSLNLLYFHPQSMERAIGAQERIVECFLGETSKFEA